MSEILKCGRKEFTLEDGDTVMDNGACLQLVTRFIRKGWDKSIPRVSKKEFERFKKMQNVSINTNHKHGDRVTLWTFLNR